MKEKDVIPVFSFFFIGCDNIEEAAREALYRAGGSIEMSDRVRPELVKVVLPPTQAIAERIDHGDRIAHGKKTLFRVWEQDEFICVSRSFREGNGSLSLFRYEQYEQEAVILYC